MERDDRRGGIYKGDALSSAYLMLLCAFMWKFVAKYQESYAHELAIEGGRLFAMDFSYQNLILSRRISAMGGMHMLNKIYLINPRENEDIHLPPSTKAVKDIQISPCGRFTLLASLGKKLSILSLRRSPITLNSSTPPMKEDAVSMLWKQVKHKLPGVQLAVHRNR
ncbi:hypothetical protein DKX38_016516 [Salix brachista]|uniref:Uncharacterized protein n=1 Tax=Salix brachista TaxID=2182728 RepID=A0A5N5L859_9ROSI|nr:hypothetical protein DKX38_016516 [Salix brachista]